MTATILDTRTATQDDWLFAPAPRHDVDATASHGDDELAEVREMLGTAASPYEAGSGPASLPLEAGRLDAAPWAFTTRRIRREDVRVLLRNAVSPRPGDLVLARVDAIGHHGKLQLVDGRRRQLFPGDEVVVVYGHRYACEQFEALVPDNLGPCHLVAGGGIASRAVSWHDRIVRGPTRITPLGLLGDAAGRPLNLWDYRLPMVTTQAVAKPPVFAILGTAMDAGKTQTAAYLCRGLIGAGMRAGYAKVTGTGAGGDTWLLRDAGAVSVVDFSDAGLASTYLADADVIDGVLTTLVGHLGSVGCDAIVIEIADGVFQRETSALLDSPVFQATADAVVIAARDAMGAAAASQRVRDNPVPIVALSGLLSASPLQCREASAMTGIDVLKRKDLATPAIARGLVEVISRDHDAQAPQSVRA